MNKGTPPLSKADEVSDLIETLHATEKRLEKLTAGEVDTVADRDGRTFLLLRAQEQLRHIEFAKQAAILNALPAHIALLDARGVIVSVNEAWRNFARTNVLQAPGHAIDLNYLEICYNARGNCSSEAHQAAAGISSVLNGEIKSFSIEYPCHSQTERRWFQMTVTLLADGHPNGAVVMHMDVTAERQINESLQASELRFRQMAENIRDVFFLIDADSDRIVYISPAYEEIWGRSRERLYTGSETWTETIHQDDLASARKKYEKTRSIGQFEQEYRIVHPNGSIRWIETRGFPIRDEAGKLVRIAGIAKDVTERKQAEEEIILKSTILQTQQEVSLDAILVVDENGRISSYNQQFIELWRLSPQLVSARLDAPVLQAVVDQAQDSEGFSDRVKYLYAHRDDKSREEISLKDDRTIDRYSAPIKGKDGAYYGRVWYFRDITERKQAEIKLVQLNRVYAMLSGINTLIVHANNRDELFNEACRLAVEVGGFRMSMIGIVEPGGAKIVPVTMVGKNEELVAAIKRLLSSGDLASSTMVARAIRDKKAIVSNDSQSDPQVLLGSKYAESGVCAMAILPLIVSDNAVGALALYASEIDFFHEEELALLSKLAGDIAFAIDHIDKQDRLDYLACYDTLTGLANRTLFLERVAQYIRVAAGAGHKLAVGMIDLERFKNINDSLGRPAGDALLTQVAERLTHIAGGDGLLARLGADHFAIVLPEVTQEGSMARLIEKSIDAFMGHPFQLNDAVFRIAIKAGIAMFPEDGADADLLLRNAEAALKKAKASGERYLCYTQKMTVSVAAKLTLENQLRQALDNEEFVLHYQPKVNLASGKVTSAEALIRWNDPRTGLVPPGHFIPILEETGLIYEVGRWALRQAIADYLRWRAAGLAAVRIAVNVSPRQLRNRGFVAEIEQIIDIDAHAAAGLELEITESLIMEDVKHSITSLQAIRDRGVLIAIDDFGTGYSSLSYLAKLPVDTLKIDRSFVVDMTNGTEGQALVSTIITLAHSLKLKVVAEGVETEEQSSLLLSMSCDEMQGYLFSKPVPGEVFKAKYLVPLGKRRTA